MVKDHFSTMLNRRNVFTGRAWKDEPAIFGFDLFNEPRCPNAQDKEGCPEIVTAWINEMSAHIKGIDSKHLVTVGEEGFFEYDSGLKDADPWGIPENVAPMGRYWSASVGQDFTKQHAGGSIDFAAIHMWPDNWNTTDLAFPPVWIDSHIKEARKLGKPLLLEGEAGVGKTQVAKTLAAVLDTPLIRLQCYEGLDVNNTIYEWNYTRQLLHIRMLEAQSCDIDASVERDLFGPEYLIKRPLLQAIEQSASGRAPVLLIDELDRADEEFEAFLLELLSDFQITIPEIGTMRAEKPPVVVITSNRTREIHDALKRRCIYHWIDYPTLEKEYCIVNLKVPGASALLARQLVHFVQELRRLDLYKLPGVAETLDWAEALVALDARELNLPVVGETLGLLLKYQDDFEAVRKGQVERILARAQAGAADRVLESAAIACP
jgi:MoxR-like ATPase